VSFTDNLEQRNAAQLLSKSYEIYRFSYIMRHEHRPLHDIPGEDGC